METAAATMLAIETSNPSGQAGAGPGGPGVAVGWVDGAGVTVLGVERLRTTGRHDDDLMPAIDRLCRRAGVTPRQIGPVAVSIGPGGYTALRVAVATAKMIAEANGGRCIAVPTAMVVAQRLAEMDRAAGYAVALASKSAASGAETAWVAVSLGGELTLEQATRGRVIGAADIGRLGVGVLVADRFFPEAMRSAAERAGMRLVEPVFDPAACLELAVSRAGPAIDPVELAPLYPREPEAVTLWRNRSGGSAPSTT
jgi:tRNA threonylcarbamoyladenosine biosynthesis protein TsaB